MAGSLGGTCVLTLSSHRTCGVHMAYAYFVPIGTVWNQHFLRFSKYERLDLALFSKQWLRLRGFIFLFRIKPDGRGQTGGRESGRNIRFDIVVA